MICRFYAIVKVFLQIKPLNIIHNQETIWLPLVTEASCRLIKEWKYHPLLLHVTQWSDTPHPQIVNLKTTCIFYRPLSTIQLEPYFAKDNPTKRLTSVDDLTIAFLGVTVCWLDKVPHTSYSKQLFLRFTAWNDQWSLVSLASSSFAFNLKPN